MIGISDSSVAIQVSSQFVPSTPAWFGEMALIAHYLKRQGVLAALEEQVHFAHRRFGHYEMIDFVAVLLSYAISGERILEAFYERLQPFAHTFMALFGRERLPHRSTLSRFLAALDQAPIEALRTLFLEDLSTRPLEKSEKPGGLWDRQGNHWVVFDVDGTRQVARQRAVPCTPDRPPAQRRLSEVCAPGYTGRKRGEVVRTRTTVLQAHTHQWVGTYAGAGNGDYRGELRQAVKAKSRVRESSISFSESGSSTPGRSIRQWSHCGGFGWTLVCDAGQGVQTRLTQPPDQQTSHPETGTCRALFDFPDLSLSPIGPRTRVIVATHPATETEAKIGITRGKVVYELFYTALPQAAFTPADVVDLYLHRGGFECVLADEDQEQATDRWCSHTTWGQEFWQILAQWVWNLRLELGHALHPTPMRTTEFASAQMGEPAPDPASQPASTSPCCLRAATVGPPIVHQRVCRS